MLVVFVRVNNLTSERLHTLYVWVSVKDSFIHSGKPTALKCRVSVRGREAFSTSNGIRGELCSQILSCRVQQIVRDVQPSSDHLFSCAASSREQSSCSSYYCYIIVIALLLHCPSGARGRVPLIEDTTVMESCCVHDS